VACGMAHGPVKRRWLSVMRFRSNDRDSLRYERPEKKLRTVSRAIQRNDDLQLFLWIIERKTILDFLLQALPLVVRGDDNADRGLPVFFVNRPAYHTPRQSQQARITEIDIADE